MVRNVEATGQAIQVSAPTQITQKTVGPLEHQIDTAISDKPEGIDLNMGGVEIVDSFGLNWLIETQARLTGCGINLQLTDVTRLVADILMATRLDTRFTVLAKAEGERNA